MDDWCSPWTTSSKDVHMSHDIMTTLFLLFSCFVKINLVNVVNVSPHLLQLLICDVKSKLLNKVRVMDDHVYTDS